MQDDFSLQWFFVTICVYFCSWTFQKKLLALCHLYTILFACVYFYFFPSDYVYFLMFTCLYDGYILFFSSIQTMCSLRNSYIALFRLRLTFVPLLFTFCLFSVTLTNRYLCLSLLFCRRLPAFLLVYLHTFTPICVYFCLFPSWSMKFSEMCLPFCLQLLVSGTSLDYIFYQLHFFTIKYFCFYIVYLLVRHFFVFFTYSYNIYSPLCKVVFSFVCLHLRICYASINFSNHYVRLWLLLLESSLVYVFL